MKRNSCENTEEYTIDGTRRKIACILFSNEITMNIFFCTLHKEAIKVKMCNH